MHEDFRFSGETLVPVSSSCFVSQFRSQEPIYALARTSVRVKLGLELLFTSWILNESQLLPFVYPIACYLEKKRLNN